MEDDFFAEFFKFFFGIFFVKNAEFFAAHADAGEHVVAGLD